MPQTTLENVLCYEELIADQSSDFEWPEFDENTASGMCYTSGTTGNPKGVVYSHRSTLLHAYAGALPDVTDMFKKYGAIPQEVYAGLNYGEDINRHGEMEAILTGMLDAVIANKNKKLSPVWKDAYNAVLDTYLGKVPTDFDYKGKNIHLNLLVKK